MTRSVRAKSSGRSVHRVPDNVDHAGPHLPIRPSAGNFALSDQSLGPVFVERAETIGKGGVSLAFTYLYGNFDQFDGGDFTMKSTVSSGGNGGGHTVRTLADISIPIHQFALSATYGITDEWDVDVFLPLLYPRLRVDTQQTTQDFGEGPPVGPPSPLPASTFNQGAFGVGDMLLRTNYRLGLSTTSALLSASCWACRRAIRTTSAAPVTGGSSRWPSCLGTSDGATST